MFQILDTTIKMARGDTIYFDQVLVDMQGNIRELNEYDETGKQLTNNTMKFYLTTTPIQEPNKVSQTKLDGDGSPIIEPPDSLVFQKTFTDRRICLEPDDTRYLKTGCYYYKTVAYFEEKVVIKLDKNENNNESNDNDELQDGESDENKDKDDVNKEELIENNDNKDSRSSLIERLNGFTEVLPSEPPESNDKDNKDEDNNENDKNEEDKIEEVTEIIKYIIHPQTVSAGRLYLMF